MISYTRINSDNEKLAGYLTDYKVKFEGLESDWKGISYESLRTKVTAFSEESMRVVSMMNYLSAIAKSYEEYESAVKENSELKKKSANEAATLSETNLFNIADIEDVSIGTTNFIGYQFNINKIIAASSRRSSTTEESIIDKYMSKYTTGETTSNKKDGLFRLDTNIATNTVFKNIQSNISQLRSIISSYDITMTSTGFSVRMTSAIQKITKNLDTCCKRIGNTITAITAVLDNHIKLQEKLVEYVAGVEKEASTPVKTVVQKPVEKEEEVPVIEAQLPATGGSGGGSSTGETPAVVETQSEEEVEVPTTSKDGSIAPILGSNPRQETSSGSGFFPALAGIGLVGAAGGGLAIVAKKKKDEENEELMDDEDFDDEVLSPGFKRKKSSSKKEDSQDKEWLYSLGLGINDDLDDSQATTNISVGARQN